MGLIRKNKHSEITQKEHLKAFLISLKEKGNCEGLSDEKILQLINAEISKKHTHRKYPLVNVILNLHFSLFFFVVITVCAFIYNGKEFKLNRCIIENNYFIMETTRPVTNCDICKDIDDFTILSDVTKEEFYKYAYLSHPLLVKGGCSNWSAIEVFNYDFFKSLYNSIEGAYKSVEEDCQFFPFRTKFLNLREVFKMSEERAKLSKNEETWYIGWSNCNPDVSDIIRKHYSKPHFLPEDSELSAIDWIFMGYNGPGASMHLDYVRRPSWQAQIRGRKTWYLLPPPECEQVCSPMNITVEKGDIILVDTNQWYHTTVIEGTEMSLTLGSEYD